MSEGRKIIATQGQRILHNLKSVIAKVRRGTCIEKPPSSEVELLRRTGLATAEPKARHRRQKILAFAGAYRASRAGTFCRARDSEPKTAVVELVSHSDSGKTSETLSFVARGQTVRLRPKSAVAEAYRTIRTAVFFSAPKAEAKIVLVTSPEQGDGKTTLASNLAIAMAQAGQKTLVLDGDFRRPTQHKIFEFDNKIGLANVLAGTIRLDEAIQTGPIPGLDILSCGPEVPNPSEILNSDTFAEVLKNLCKCYDRVIIDSPPVIPVTDSQILAAICDVTLLVLKADKSTRRHSRYARDCLLSVGAHILGAVINDVPHKRGQYGYYSRYGHYGGYGHHYGYYGEQAEKTG